MKPIKDYTPKDTQKLGKAIQKLIGEKNFMLIIEDDNHLSNLSNMKNRVEIIGLLDMTKHDYLTRDSKVVSIPSTD